ncbi:MAG: rhodanese-like domain-containing protein [Myxococcota bacterium]|nr:rhodanese-like domain-containing protein [Myxococcota bacterium]
MSRQHAPRFLAAVEAARVRIEEIDVRGAMDAIQAASPALLVDVREAHEWRAGHATGAVHISKGVLERDIESAVPDTNTPVILYCGGGFRSALAADALQEMGYRRVWSLAGGWRAWCAADAPVTIPP